MTRSWHEDLVGVTIDRVFLSDRRAGQTGIGGSAVKAVSPFKKEEKR